MNAEHEHGSEDAGARVEQGAPRGRAQRRARESSVAYPIWIATGTAVAGVLLGGAAVYLGLQDRLTQRDDLAVTSASQACACASPTPMDDPPGDVAVHTVEPDAAPASAASSLVQAVERTRPMVVALSSGGSIGAGVIVDERGAVLTNYHVIASATRGTRGIDDQVLPIVARFADGRELPAVLLAADSGQDIALLRLQPADSAERFTPATLGRSSAMPVGSSVFAVGTPLGYDHSVSAGIISAVDRTHVLANRQLPLLQLDASINVGNSGGPLFNFDGELVGVITAKTARGQGIAFAIPIDHVRALISAFEGGTVRSSGQIGVEIDLKRDIDASVRELGFRNGVIIKKIVANQPAARAGLREGDIIVALRGRRYDSFGTGPAAQVAIAEEFVRVIRALIPGERLELTVVRGGTIVPLTIEAAAATAEQQLLIDGDELLGLVFVKKTAAGGERYEIAAVRPGSAVAGLRGANQLVGAEIVRIIGRAVGSVNDLGAALADIRERVSPGGGGRISITFKLASGREAVVPHYPLSTR